MRVRLSWVYAYLRGQIVKRKGRGSSGTDAKPGDRSGLSGIQAILLSLRPTSFKAQAWIVLAVYLACVVRHYQMPAEHHAKLFLAFVACELLLFLVHLASQKFFEPAK